MTQNASGGRPVEVRQRASPLEGAQPRKVVHQRHVRVDVVTDERLRILRIREADRDLHRHRRCVSPTSTQRNQHDQPLGQDPVSGGESADRAQFHAATASHHARVLGREPDRHVRRRGQRDGLPHLRRSRAHRRGRRMATPVIIEAAINGATTKATNPNVPTTARRSRPTRSRSSPQVQRSCTSTAIRSAVPTTRWPSATSRRSDPCGTSGPTRRCTRRPTSRPAASASATSDRSPRRGCGSACSIPVR